MNWPDLVSEGLPPPRSDEPVRLRQDIADELADHLTCALSRELRRADDETAARRAVLDRFGDPRAIARRLWFDAMKEIIMRERLVLVLAGVLLITVLVGGLLTWQSMKMNREVNQAILAKLDSMNAPAARAEVPENWSKAKIRLVRGTPDGPPVTGSEVELEGKPFNDVDMKTLSAESGNQGLVEFGPIRPGDYQLNLGFFMVGPMAPRRVNLYTGQVYEKTIVVPEWVNNEPEVSIRIAPALTQIKELAFLGCHFVPDQTSVQCGSDCWKVHSVSFAVNALNEEIVNYFVAGQPLPPPPPEPTRAASGVRGASTPPGFGGPDTAHVFAVRGAMPSTSTGSTPPESRKTLPLPPVRYRLTHLSADVAIEARSPGSHPVCQTAAEFSYAEQRSRSEIAPEAPPSGTSSRNWPLDDETGKMLPAFDVRRTGENVWTIEPPPGFVEKIMESIKVLNERKVAKGQPETGIEKATPSRSMSGSPALPPAQTPPTTSPATRSQP